ncbi:MAG: GNAT family N-acyltransferase [Burkholderiaceae bacterium]
MKELPIPTLALSTIHLPQEAAHTHPYAVSGIVRELDGPPVGRVHVVWARHQDEMRLAQRLRYQIFATEMGAKLDTPLAGHDIDRFDDYCEHLLARDTETGQVVGTYRVLTPAQAVRAGGSYSDTEFDLSPLRDLRTKMVELGRSCVHAQFRQGGVILALGSALYEFMARNKLETMMGCASIPMLHNGMVSGDVAASVWRQMQEKHMASPELQVKARLPLPVEKLDNCLDVAPPAMIKGYLRQGAKVLGAPAWDPDFNTADLPLLIHVKDAPSRFLKHFSGAV